MRKLFSLILVAYMAITCVAHPALGAERVPGYQNIPGVTQQEIDAIETLKATRSAFSYSTTLSTEAFIDSNGKISGYTAELCALLSQLFGIEFVPSIQGWDAIVEGLANHTIDFSGDFSITPERSSSYFMSEPIAVRSIALFSLDGNAMKKITENHTPTLGFAHWAVHRSKLDSVFDGPYEAVEFYRLRDVISALESGQIDAFVANSITQPLFESNSPIVCEVFSPLICDSVAMTTQNAELEPILSVFNKYIENGGRDTLSALYGSGMAAYTGNLLYQKFTSEEKAYISSHIASNKKIPVILESGNYPISFYNERSGQYEGIVADLLEKVTLLTGLQFEAINDPADSWATVLANLQSGEASIISELLHTSSREGQFLWPEEPSNVTSYALLSKSEAPSLEVYQMLGKRIGVETDTAYQDVASRWFPDVELLTYDDIDGAFDAMDKGEIDLIMASENVLLSQTNYNEKPGYKINFTIDHTAESKPGFNINEEVLLSIYNKAFAFINSNVIVRDWTNRVFDYSGRLAQARINLLLISAVFLAAFVILLTVFLIKNNHHRRDLSMLVKSRTAQLEEKTATLSTVYNAIPDMLFSKDLQGRYTSCNPSFASYAGLPEEEILGRQMPDVLANISKDALALYARQDEEVTAADKTLVYEHWVSYPNGEKRLLETVKTTLKQNDAIVGIISISRDITAHKEAQEAALAASKAKSSFLARMSHEIRTPLNAIIGMAEITKASVGDTEKTLSSVNQIIISSYHLLNLINDVLDMSKIESGSFEILHEPFSLRRALDELIVIISSRYMEKHIQFENNVGSIPDTGIVGDKLRLNQVLINLLSNAIKFTDAHGYIKFETTILEETKDNIRIRFAIKDSGIGMTEEQMSRLFKPFEQADSSIASRFGGTGLGLSISHNLIQLMGGTILLESRLGEGSEFYFELLFEKGELSEHPVEVPVHDLDLTNARILLAEDIELNRMIIQELLASTGAIIEMAANGREAVEMFERSAIDEYNLIFMDVQMPEMNGYEATAKIRALPRTDAKSIPIVAMTANAYREDVEQALASGMNRHISKPINVDILMKTLAIYLANGGDRGSDGNKDR